MVCFDKFCKDTKKKNQFNYLWPYEKTVDPFGRCGTTLRYEDIRDGGELLFVMK